MSESLYAGMTSQTIDVFLGDSSSTTGGGLTGLTHSSSGLTAYYRKGATGTATAITLATQTVGGAWSSGGFVQVDSTNMPGVYRFDVPNAAVDTEGFVTIYFRGATNLVPTALRIDCRPYPVDVKKFGGTNGTFSGGRPEVNTTRWGGTAVSATLFDGITYLARWLGAIAGKTADTTTRTEINATTAGAAYNETTDSLEAVRDRGDAAWITGTGSGSGAYTLTITVKDASNVNLQNATVRLAEGANVFTATTNASGVATFSVDAATYSVAITKDGYQFTPTTLAVSATASQTYNMTTTTITPSDPAQTTGYVTIYTGAHVAVSGAVVQVQVLKLKNGTTGSGIDDPLLSQTTNGSGYAEFVGLPRGATYQVRVDGGPWFRGVTAEAATTPLAGVLGLPE
jgi:hypothetical protein